MVFHRMFFTDGLIDDLTEEELKEGFLYRSKNNFTILI